MTKLKLSDEQAACNYIKRIREYCKKSKSKCTRTPLNINDAHIDNIIVLKHNPLTKKDSFSCAGIGYKKIAIYPTTNQKLRCTNQHALDVMKKHKEFSKKTQDKITLNRRLSGKHIIKMRKSKNWLWTINTTAEELLSQPKTLELMNELTKVITK